MSSNRLSSKRFAIPAGVLLMAACASEKPTTSPSPYVDFRLSALLDGTSDGSGLQRRDLPSGGYQYAVILRLTDVDAVRKAGIPLASVAGSVATAYLTVEELRSATKAAGIVSIELPELREPD